MPIYIYTIQSVFPLPVCVCKVVAITLWGVEQTKLCSVTCGANYTCHLAKVLFEIVLQTANCKIKAKGKSLNRDRYSTRAQARQLL
jgi:hypothetical protein